MLENLEPKKVFKYFEEMSMIPRGSGNTDGMVKYLVEFAKKNNLEYLTDENNNVIIKKNNNNNKDTIIIQGHTDMVCVKTNDCNKDLKKEHIDLIIDGEYLKADKTSLGGDDGIAVAMMLSILEEDNSEYPSIECLFTADEETGMYGALGLDGTKLEGRKLINIDSEEEGIFTVSCAGGAHVEGSIQCKKEKIDAKGYKLKINNLLGGHSGMSIQKTRANANVEMIRLLYDIINEGYDIRLSKINGGQFDNVICQENICEIVLLDGKNEEFEKYINDYDKKLKNEYLISDSKITLTIENCDVDDVFTKEDTKNIVSLYFTLPNGLIELSISFDNLPQTSLNLGVLKTENDIVKSVHLVRSSIDSRKQYIVDKMIAIAKLHNATFKINGSYPAWQYNKESKLRPLLVDTYKKLYNKEPLIEATHGGLECGLFMDKIKGLDAISIGPNVFDVHSVDEKLEIKSVERIYQFLQEVLKKC